MLEKNELELKSRPSFNWQFSLKEKRFDCDPLLPSFLGFHQQRKISISQLFSCFDRRQASEITRAFKAVIASQTSFDTFVIINTLEKRSLIKLTINPIKNKKSAVQGELCYLQLLPSIEQENESLKEMFYSAETGRMLATSDHIIIMVNKAFCKETGYQEHELLGKHAHILKSGDYSKEFYKRLWETIDTTKFWRGELLAHTKQKEIYTREVQIQRFEIEHGSHFYFASSINLDVPASLLHSLPQKGDNSHSHIPKKAKYNAELQQCFEKISSEQTIVVATFKINWLQKISDFTACWLVSQRFQTSKIVGTIGEISQGIYSIYWVDDKNPDKIDTLLRQLLSVFSYGFENGGFDIFSTVNIGASILSVDGKNPAQLISHSTQTLIANPTREYSSLYYYDRRLAKRFDRHQVLAKLLKQALNNKQVEVYYQPIVEIPSLKIREFEALFRIKLDTELDYNTQELINIAEAYNWIDEVDAMVTKIALNALPELQKHYANDDIAIAINRSLANDRVTHCCLEDTIDILVASGANLKNVTIELTESAIFENFDQQKQWVEALQKHGVKIAIDDFGTGYSSFAYLNNLPVNFIKIDRSFVTDLTLDSNEYAMIEMLCKLARKIGAKVIAEGVETAAEFRLLSRAKVDLLQGYIFSKPLSLTKILSTPATPFPQALSQCIYQKQIASIADIYIKEFKTVEFDDRLSSIKEQLALEGGAYFIVLENKKCRGILYSHDYYATVSPYLDTKSEQNRDLLTLDKRVHQVMEKDVKTLHIDSDIKLAERFFSAHPHSIIVITNNEDECMGIATVQALLRYQQLTSGDVESDDHYGANI